MRHRRVLVFLVAFFAFLALYQFTGVAALSSVDFAAYPFGSDVPRYLTGLGNPNHSLTVELLRAYRGLVFGVIGWRESGALLKLPFALCGAFNVCLALAAFANLGQGIRSLLFGAAYGSALSIWYFASVPESYVLSALLYSLYVWLFMNGCRQEPSGRSTALASLALAAAILNDVSAALLLIIPVVYYARSGLARPRIAVHLGVQIAITFLLIVPLGLASGWLAIYIETFRHYTPIDPAAGWSSLFYAYDVSEPFLNFFFFGVGAPAATVTFANRMFPDYVGFFEPTLLTYLAHPATLVFLVAYLAVLGQIRPSRRTPLVVALASFVLARFVLVMLFNPGEAILYVNVSVLPFFLVLFHFLESAQHRHRTLLAAAFLVGVFAANARFLS